MSVCPGVLRRQLEPQQLPELPAPLAFKRPKKPRLMERRDLCGRVRFLEEAQENGEKIFFAERPTSGRTPSWQVGAEGRAGRSARSLAYSAVCLGSSAAFLEQLREKHGGRLNVIWDNAPAHRGEAVRELLKRPGLNLRLVNLPGYSPDFNADEAIWGWAREEATGNLCLGSKGLVQERVGSFLAGLVSRKDEVKRRCRTVLQSRTAGLLRSTQPDSQHPANAHPTLALV